MPLNGPTRFTKPTPGAESFYQPDDLGEYADDEWDVRISIGNAPIDEAFYLMVKDPQEAKLSIREVLERHALNPDRSNDLDVENYPELPFLQEELIQLWQSRQRGRIDVDVYINFGGADPISIDDPAATHMGVCKYFDDTWDYPVLDLVFVPYASGTDLDWSDLRRQYQEMFLLLMLRDLAAQGVQVLDPTADKKAPGEQRAMLQTTVGELQRKQLISRRKGPLSLTKTGAIKADELAAEAERIAATYAPYSSVSLTPLGIGVPNGLDLRVQMMERGEDDVDRAAMLCVLHLDADELFEESCWNENLLNAAGFDLVIDALSFKTNLTNAVLDEVAALVEPTQ